MILEEMNVYLDNPQRYVGSVYDRLLYADQPLGWDILGTKETIEAATRETFISYLDSWYRPERIVVGVGGRIGEGLMTVSKSCSEASSRGRPPSRPRTRAPARRLSGSAPHEAVGAGPPHPRRARLPDRAPRPLRAPAPRGRSRRRNVLATVHRGTREARARRTTSTPATPRTRTPARSTRARESTSTRVDEAITTILGELAEDRGRARARRELEKARGYAKGRFVLRLESPQGTIQYGLRREVLEGEIEEPDELFAPARRRHGRGRPARRTRSARGQAALPRGRRAVRRPRAVREAARGLTRGERRARAAPAHGGDRCGFPRLARRAAGLAARDGRRAARDARRRRSRTSRSDPLDVIEELAAAADRGIVGNPERALLRLRHRRRASRPRSQPTG